MKWPRQVSTSHALVSLILHNLTSRSSPAETIKGNVGWNATQLTPLSWPSRTNFTTASVLPNMSAWFWFWRTVSSKVIDVGAECFFRRPEMSHTRTDWSRLAETMRSRKDVRRERPGSERSSEVSYRPWDGTGHTLRNGCGLFTPRSAPQPAIWGNGDMPVNTARLCRDCPVVNSKRLAPNTRNAASPTIPYSDCLIV